jgi:hypothetical protein
MLNEQFCFFKLPGNRTTVRNRIADGGEHMRILILSAILAVTACTTDAPVKTGKDTYLVQGGVGLVGAPPDMQIKRANEFCAKQGKEAVINELTTWIAGRQFPSAQFTCTNDPTPSTLRPDNGINTIQNH